MLLLNDHRGHMSQDVVSQKLFEYLGKPSKEEFHELLQEYADVRRGANLGRNVFDVHQVLSYVQQCENVRKDVQLLETSQMGDPWFIDMHRDNYRLRFPSICIL